MQVIRELSLFWIQHFKAQKKKQWWDFVCLVLRFHATFLSLTECSDTLIWHLCLADIESEQSDICAINHCLVSVCPVVEGEDSQLWQPGLLPFTQAPSQSLSRATCDPAAQKGVSVLLLNHFLSVWLRRNTTPACVPLPLSPSVSPFLESSPRALPRTDLGLPSVS